MYRTIKKVVFIGILATVSFSSCKREWDSPPKKTIPEGKLLTISDLYRIYDDSIAALDPVSNTPLRSLYRFEDDFSVYATVTMDDNKGNIYKTAYVQDDSMAITLNTPYSGGFNQGDYVRIYLKGTTLKMSNEVLVLDSVDVDENIIKQETGIDIEPKLVTFSTISNNDIGRLIKLENVEIDGSRAGKTFATKNGTSASEYNLVDCSGNFSLLVRTSDYATFAGDTIPEENGTITGILGAYNGTYQFLIRDPSELEFNDPRCSMFTEWIKDFDDGDLYSGGWTSYSVAGAEVWEYGSQGGDYAQISGFQGSTNNEDWLISPVIDGTQFSNLYVSFRNAKNYTGADLELYVSSDYDGSSNPNNASWTQLSFNKSAGSWSWVDSGDINLTNYKGATTYIAFKYTSTPSAAATWEIDDIQLLYTK